MALEVSVFVETLRNQIRFAGVPLFQYQLGTGGSVDWWLLAWNVNGALSACLEVVVRNFSFEDGFT